MKLIDRGHGLISVFPEKHDRCHICGGNMAKCGCGWSAKKSWVTRLRELVNPPIKRRIVGNVRITTYETDREINIWVNSKNDPGNEGVLLEINKVGQRVVFHPDEGVDSSTDTVVDLAEEYEH